jgi:FkbM family methyltransferase
MERSVPLIAERVGKFVACFNVRGVPRFLHGLRRCLKSSQPFHLKTGVKLRLNLEDYFESMMLWGRYQRGLLALLKLLLRPGMIAIDGGAHIGYISLHMGQIVGPRGKVYAFEPDPRAYARLVSGITLNHMADTVEPMNCALASRDGALDLFLSPQLGWSTAVEGSHLTNLTRVSVRSVSIDSMANQGYISAEDVGFIKLDLEGFEGQALAGMKDLLLANQPFIMFEVNRLMLNARGEDPRKLVQLVCGLGFHVFVIESHMKLSGGDNVELREIGHGLVDRDCDVLAVPHARLAEVAGLVAV